MLEQRVSVNSPNGPHADGVGGWIDSGVDAGIYSRALMAGARRSLEARVAATDGGAIDVDPLDILEDGYRETTVLGSSTACVATVSSRGLLRVRNLGDSGMLAYRHERSLTPLSGSALRVEEAEKLWTPLFKTTEQVHDFNFPYQLEAAERSDKPSAAQALSYWALPGDLLLLATDGFLDNMWPRDTLRALSKVDWQPCAALVRLKRARIAEARTAELAVTGSAAPWSPVKVAGHSAPISAAEMAVAEKACRATLLSISAALAVGAQRVGMDRTAKSPFADGARRAGMRYSGGKPDDIAVVAAIVLPDESRALLAERAEESVEAKPWGKGDVDELTWQG